eukprot:10317742-Alexandrium_andersonii.AAC.1
MACEVRALRYSRVRRSVPPESVRPLCLRIRACPYEPPVGFLECTRQDAGPAWRMKYGAPANSESGIGTASGL